MYKHLKSNIYMLMVTLKPFITFNLNYSQKKQLFYILAVSHYF